MRDMQFSGALAKEIREQRGLNRVAACAAAGLSRQGLINIENGVSVPSVDTLGRMATAYKAGVGEFYVVHTPDADTAPIAGEESPNDHEPGAASDSSGARLAHQGG